MQGGANSSEFRIPDSELDGSVELRIPSPQPSRLTPVPSDKILLPRRMLYVEAVLYATVAMTAFGLGYLAGRGEWLAAGKDDAGVQKRVPVEGKVMLSSSGTKTRRRRGCHRCLARRQVARQTVADRRLATRWSVAVQGRRDVCRVG